MQRPAVLAAILLAVVATAPAHAVSETDEGFAAALRGCWMQTRFDRWTEEQRQRLDFDVGLQLCLDGKTAGPVEGFSCETRLMVDCSQLNYRFEFKDQRFWRYFEVETRDGYAISCDVRLLSSQQFELFGCLGHAEDGTVIGPVDDTAFERARDIW